MSANHRGQIIQAYHCRCPFMHISYMISSPGGFICALLDPCCYWLCGHVLVDCDDVSDCDDLCDLLDCGELCDLAVCDDFFIWRVVMICVVW